MNDAQHDALGRYLRSLADAMQLRDWVIELQRERPEPEGAWASVVVCRWHQTAWVRVAWPEFFDTRPPERQRVDLVHELVHVHLDRPHQLMDDLAGMFGENTATQLAKDRHQVEIEVATETLARVIAPFMPMPPAWTELRESAGHGHV
ncbi:MAG: hypothetical protein KC442_21080 [Thermomicrobiales bacterium]|nr:hypothetical protein [Thermomicrobiales bacterium]